MSNTERTFTLSGVHVEEKFAILRERLVAVPDIPIVNVAPVLIVGRVEAADATRTLELVLGLYASAKEHCTVAFHKDRPFSLVK